MDYEFFFFCHLNWSILTLSQKMGQIIKVQRPVSSAPINGLYHRPLLAARIYDIRGRIYNSFAGGIIVQI